LPDRFYPLQSGVSQKFCFSRFPKQPGTFAEVIPKPQQFAISWSDELFHNLENKFNYEFKNKFNASTDFSH